MSNSHESSLISNILVIVKCHKSVFFSRHLRITYFHGDNERRLKERDRTKTSKDRYHREPRVIRCRHHDCDSTNHNRRNTYVKNDFSAKPEKRVEKNISKKNGGKMKKNYFWMQSVWIDSCVVSRQRPPSFDRKTFYGFSRVSDSDVLAQRINHFHFQSIFTTIKRRRCVALSNDDLSWFLYRNQTVKCFSFKEIPISVKSEVDIILQRQRSIDAYAKSHQVAQFYL